MKSRVTEIRTYIHLAIGQTFNSENGSGHKGSPGSLFGGGARRAIPAGPGLWAARDCATPYRHMSVREHQSRAGGAFGQISQMISAKSEAPHGRNR